MTGPIQKSFFNINKQRLWIALPLIPVFSGLSFLITVCSPLAWGPKGYIPLVGVLAICLGIIFAYCTVIFIEECFKKFGANTKI